MNEKELIKLAYRLAEKGHAGQTRYDGVTPYMAHVHDVANRIRRDKETTVEHLVVAVLHDVVEDTHYTLDYLKEAGFPTDIIKALDAITHPKQEPYDQYIDRVMNNPIARVVKRADISSNMDDEPSEESKQNYYKFFDRIYHLH